MNKNNNFNVKSLLVGFFLSLIVVVWFTFRIQLQSYLMSFNSSQVTVENESGVKLVNSEEFNQLISNDSVFVIDVHTPKQTHIPGTDALIPFDQIPQYLEQLPEDKSTPIAVYCRSGSMSKGASKELYKLGYENVYDLEGGTNAYKEQQVSVSLLPEKRELGTVIYGDVATTEFTFTNYMPLPIKITRVSTSCGCTKAEVESEELGPYESTTVNVSFDPAVHKDDTDLGELSRTIYIETDRDDYKELEAVITANVIKE